MDEIEITLPYYIKKEFHWCIHPDELRNRDINLSEYMEEKIRENIHREFYDLTDGCSYELDFGAVKVNGELPPRCRDCNTYGTYDANYCTECGGEL